MRIGFVFKATATREMIQAECRQHFQYIYGVNSASVRTAANSRFQVTVDIEEDRYSVLDQLKDAINSYGGNITDLEWVT